MAYLKSTGLNKVSYPSGVVTAMGFLTRKGLTSGNSKSGTLGGTGEQIVPFTNIEDGFTNSNWTNPILTLSSNLFTLAIGVYYYQFHRTTHAASHVWTHGVRRYGDSAGSGSSLSNITTPGISFGSTLLYDSDTSTTMINYGILEVAYTAQKHGCYQYTQLNSEVESGVFTPSSNNYIIQAIASFMKIG